MLAFDLGAQDFLYELMMAPKWDIFQYYQDGYWQLWVFYPFASYAFNSPSIQDMSISESKDFCALLQELVKIPSIAEAKV